MTELVITRGLPGCGKTTWARAWVAEDNTTRARIGRDDLRAMMDDKVWIKGVTEQRVLAVRDAAILALLRKGISVVSDDTNLPQQIARMLAKLATRAGVSLRVVDMTDVPLETCIERDAARPNPVGEEKIRDLHQRFLTGRKLPLPHPVETVEVADVEIPYVVPEGAPTAIMVDVDGTVALMSGRSPYDETLVHTDHPNQNVIEVVRAMHSAGHKVIFVSARTEAAREATTIWLEEQVGVPVDALYMRKVGDSRRDWKVKLELFDAHIRHDYAIVCVFDDRRQVVDMWRRIGLTVLHVDEGDF